MPQGGDFTYLQWGIGSILARIIVGIFFVRVFYEREIYSPYDYMGNQLGEGAKRLATIIFQVGGILGQSVRVLVAALALKVVTPLEFHHCIWIIGLFAGRLDAYGRNADGHLDRCHAVLSLRGSRPIQFILDYWRTGWRMESNDASGRGCG
jgi:hypothetical protein